MSDRAFWSLFAFEYRELIRIISIELVNEDTFGEKYDINLAIGQSLSQNDHYLYVCSFIR
jgi:hypothetical protein